MHNVVIFMRLISMYVPTQLLYPNYVTLHKVYVGYSGALLPLRHLLSLPQLNCNHCHPTSCQISPCA
jgi:hypothetical protein